MWLRKWPIPGYSAFRATGRSVSLCNPAVMLLMIAIL